MSAASLLRRVKSWFGVAGRRRRANAGTPAKRWTLVAPEPNLAMAGAAVGRSAAADLNLAVALGPATDAPPPAEKVLAATPPTSRPDDEADHARLAKALEDLPGQIADAVATSAAGSKSLERIARELDGNRQARESIAKAVTRLPEAADQHNELLRHTNRILEEQSRLDSATLDAVVALRQAFRSVEESAKRHLKCIDQLESSHRQVLEVYQAMFLKAHRRLGRVSVLATLLATAALAAAAYAVYLLSTAI